MSKIPDGVEDIRGNTYHRLLVMDYVGKYGKTHKWSCMCECGNLLIVGRKGLVSGHTKSCGCLQREAVRKTGKANAGQKLYPKMNPSDWKTYSNYLRQRKHSYDVSEEDIRGLMDMQLGCCDICEESLDHLSETFNVDHCHSTGKVRGLLCTDCNLALGNFKDNKFSLGKAIGYLEKYNG